MRIVRSERADRWWLVGAVLLAALGGCGNDENVSHVPVLAYHGVTSDPEVVHDPTDVHFFDVRLAAFEEQMRYLHDEGYETISPSDYTRWIAGDDEALPDKPILVTFDDGQTSAQMATAVLDRYGLEAVMYVVSGFADGRFNGPNAEPGWYLTWDQLEDLRSSGRWTVQFHAGPQGHGYVDDPTDPTCHHFYSCRAGEDDATYEARVKADVAQGLGAMRTAFGLPDNWHGSTFAVPWDDAGSDVTPEPWLSAYFADQFPVVFVQDSYQDEADHQRYRFEIHNPTDLEDLDAALDSPRFGHDGRT